MNKQFKKEYWYKELDSHIKVTGAASGKRNTILINIDNPNLYFVVTRVNYLTTILWIEYINKLVGERFEKRKFGWLTEKRSHKKEFTNKVKLSHENNLK